MIESIRKMLGLKPKVSMAELVAAGATIVDVRTPAEFRSGHIKGSVNVPLDSISAGRHNFKDKQKPLILCCRSGMRSASAVASLKNQGFTNVTNGGGWHSLHSKIKQVK